MDAHREETVEKLIQQFENHPNRELLLQDFNKRREGLDHRHGQYGNLRTLRDFFEETMPGLRLKLASYTARVAIACSLQKGDRQVNKERFDVVFNYWSCHQKESFPRCQTWTIQLQEL